MKEWVTTYYQDGQAMSGTVYGSTLAEAQVNADALGLGRVDGELIATFDDVESAQTYWDAVAGEEGGPLDAGKDQDEC